MEGLADTRDSLVRRGNTLEFLRAIAKNQFEWYERKIFHRQLYPTRNNSIILLFPFER